MSSELSANSPTDSATPRRKRGRPPKAVSVQLDVKRTIIRTGVEVLTESPFSASSLDYILKRAGVPKGSFYYYFESKEAFGMAVLEQYDSFFARLLQRTLGDETRLPLDRIAAFVDVAASGMAKYQFNRGCAVGNLAHEVATLPPAFRQKLMQVFDQWEASLAVCLRDAVAAGQIAHHVDINIQASFFWTGWEGAVLRARLEQTRRPLDLFLQGFIAGLSVSN
ncbi:TetR/AcrR family transcriptional regulator [Yokenella regensburgei]|uniref:acrylate utilization transcriptional regulator AcuR n=1 Tax=Yokenella regensburgei TaxID=158877 RepID=UPI0031D3D5E5